MEKHFKLTDESIVLPSGVRLYRIECTKKIKGADVGDKGGFVEKDDNLSDDAWVYGNAQVFGNAQVSGDAWVSGNARVFGDARVSDNNTHCGFDCFGSANRHTHAYLTGDGSVEITCGCFRGSIGEFERKVKETHAGTVFERQYMAVLALIKLKFGLE